MTDTTLWAGDAIVLLCTQMSSDRLPMENQGIISVLLLTAWTAVAYAKRDYDLQSADYDAWSVMEPVSSAVQCAAFTWVLFAPLAAGMYSSLAAHHLLKLPADAVPQLPQMSGFGSASLWLLPPVTDSSLLAAPEVEILVAALFCLGAWRGLYSAYRTWSNFF